MIGNKKRMFRSLSMQFWGVVGWTRGPLKNWGLDGEIRC